MSTIAINAVPLSLDSIGDGAIPQALQELLDGLLTRADEQPSLIQDGQRCYVTKDGELVGTLACAIEFRLNPDTGAIGVRVTKLETKLPDLVIPATPARLIGGKAMVETRLGRQPGLPYRDTGAN